MKGDDANGDAVLPPTERKKISSLVRNLLCLPGSFTNYFLWLVVASFVMYSGYKFFLADPPGYCAKQGRVLSDEEYFQIVLGGLMKSGQMKLAPTETSVQAYLANHPKCCQVHREIDHEFFKDQRWFHFDGVNASIFYELSEEGKKHWGVGAGIGSDTHYIYITWLDGCGKRYESTGMTTDSRGY